MGANRNPTDHILLETKVFPIGFTHLNTKMLIPDFEKSDIPTHAMKFPGVQGIKLTHFARFILSLVKFDHRFLFSSYYEDDSLLLLHRTLPSQSCSIVP